VPKAGFEVLEAHYRTKSGEPSPKKDRFLVDKFDAETGARAYLPLSNPKMSGLFRRFAELADEEGFVRFANEFGCLEMHAKGAGSLTYHLIGREYPTDPFTGGLQFEFGESIDLWANEAADMRRLVSLWDAARTNDTRTLAAHIRWRSNPKAVEYVWGSKDNQGLQPFHMVAHEDTATRYRFDLFRQGALVEPAMFYIQHALNERLELNLSAPRLLWNARYQRLQVHIVPSSLKSALWLQLAKAIEGSKDYRQCDSCRIWYELGATARRGSKYCSEACRQRAKRKRVKEARELASSGLPERDIAARVGSSIEAVQRWLK